MLTFVGEFIRTFMNIRLSNMHTDAHGGRGGMQWHPSPQAIFKKLLDKNAIKAKICEPPNEFSRKLWPSCLSFKLAVVERVLLLRGGQKDRCAVNINSDVSLTPKTELHTVRESVHCFLILIKNTMRDIYSIFLQNWIKLFFYLFFKNAIRDILIILLQNWLCKYTIEFKKIQSETSRYRKIN